MDEPRAVFATAVSDELGIEYPILQSGMGGIAGPELVAEVCNAGGLGVLGATLVKPSEVAAGIELIRSRTDRPFGVNLLLPPELRRPVDAATLAEDHVAAVHAGYARMRDSLGLPARDRRPSTVPDLLPALIDLLVEARVPVFSAGLGDPGVELVERFHRIGSKVVAMVTNVDDARAVEASGVDVIIAQGLEAGGHRSHFEKPAGAELGDLGVMSLVPEVVDAVSVPVVAAGGIVDGRGLVAALALGADGILMGSRFLLTRESTAPEAHKKAILERDGRDTVVTDVISGRYARVLRNALVEQYRRCGDAPALPFPLQLLANADVRAAAEEQGDVEHLPLWCGQGAGRLDDLPWAADVVAEVIAEAGRILGHRLPAQVRRGGTP